MAECGERTEPWAPGSRIITREVVHGKIWTARPVTVVRDTPDPIALSIVPGTVDMHPRLPDRDIVPQILGCRDWRLIDMTWTGGRALYLSRPGEHVMVIAFWQADQVTLRSWYVNLQDRFQRTDLGLDYLDQELDVIVSPDLASWHWKDEEKFEALVRDGYISAKRAHELRALGEEVIRTRQAPGSLFTAGWDRRRPPPDWPIPELPPAWDAVC